MSFPTAQANLPACSPRGPFNSERQAVNTNFRIIGLTRLGIRPVSAAPEADACTSRSSELLLCNKYFYISAIQLHDTPVVLNFVAYRV